MEVAEEGAVRSGCLAQKDANEVLSSYATASAQFVDPRFSRVLI